MKALRIAGERLYPVSPLPLPDAQRDRSLQELAQCPSVQLFVERAQTALPSFALAEENAAAVAEICHGVGQVVISRRHDPAAAALLTSPSEAKACWMCSDQSGGLSASQAYLPSGSSISSVGSSGRSCRQNLAN